MYIKNHIINNFSMAFNYNNYEKKSEIKMKLYIDGAKFKYYINFLSDIKFFRSFY